MQGSRALTEVRKILRPQETLADASVWPDTIKNPLYEDEDTPLFRLDHPAQDTYHYTNIPFQATKYDLSLPGARPTDSLQIARECIRVLRGTSKAFTPREALRMLAHLVGDMHQPLHSGNAFVSASGPLRFVLPEGPTGWRTSVGGNALVYGPQDRFNLHSYWDTHIVNLAMGKDDVATYAARLVKEVPVAPEWKDTGDPDGWPERWTNEALVLAKEAHQDIKLAVYLGPDEVRDFPHRWRIEQPRRLRRPLPTADPHPAREGRLPVSRGPQEHLARPVKVKSSPIPYPRTPNPEPRTPERRTPNPEPDIVSLPTYREPLHCSAQSSKRAAPRCSSSPSSTRSRGTATKSASSSNRGRAAS